MRRFVFLLPVLLFVGILAGFVVGLKRDPALLPSQLIGKPLPALALPAVRPGDVGLTNADFQDGPALLNVFGSWCISCRMEHPFLMKLRAEGVTIHGVDWNDPPEKGAAWLAQFGDPYARVGNDPKSKTAVDLGVTGAPETFVVDRHGRVRYKQVGPISQDVWDTTLAPLMQRLRNES
jgi:cytochrome c biogenesis protein CcmG/thiol:disulfide interchange protein DsbE